MPTSSGTSPQTNNKIGDKPTARQVLDKLKIEQATCEVEFNQVNSLKHENDRLSHIIKAQEAELLSLYRKVYNFN